MKYERNNATEKVENITSGAEAALSEEEKAFIEAEAEREAAADEVLTDRERRAAYRKAQIEKKNKLKREKYAWREGVYGDAAATGGNGGNGGNGGKKRSDSGWLIAVVVLGSIALIMSTLFIVAMTVGIGNDKQLAGTVDEAYYDLVNYVDSMDVDMSKLIVSNDRKQQQRILTELSAKAQLAANDVTRLPLKDESKFYTTKFINQVGDYSKYLNNKLIDGLSITEDDKDNLQSLYEINGGLKRELTALTADMGENFDFMTLLDDGSTNDVTDKFNELESNAVDYPKLIYDGPFSDALDEKTPKGLDGEEVSLEKAMETVKSTFEAYGVGDLTAEGEGNGVIKTYNFDCETDDEGGMYVELSKTGGKVVMFECYRDCTEQRVSLDEAEQIADKFLEKLGFEDMKAVWATEKGAVAYLNFVHTINGVAVYPDMVKVTVCKERGVVSSMDAREYYLNHTERSLRTDIITAPEAQAMVNENIEQKTCRLAIVPYGETREVLTYEISGEYAGATYYVYIDATDGKEIQIFRVIETTEGQLLI